MSRSDSISAMPRVPIPLLEVMSEHAKTPMTRIQQLSFSRLAMVGGVVDKTPREVLPPPMNHIPTSYLLKHQPAFSPLAQSPRASLFRSGHSRTVSAERERERRLLEFQCSFEVRVPGKPHFITDSHPSRTPLHPKTNTPKPSSYLKLTIPTSNFLTNKSSD